MIRYGLLIFLFCRPLWAQTTVDLLKQDSSVEKISYLGGHFGRSFVELDSRINSHNRFGFFWQSKPWHSFHWNISFEYYDANGAWGKDFISYKGTTYFYQSVQYVKSAGLNFYLSKPITKESAAGFGFGIERISTEMTVNKVPFTFCIDLNDRIVICNPVTESASFFAPATLLVTEIHPALWRTLQIVIRTQLKLAHIGKRHHAHPLDSWISFTVYGGIRIGL